MLMNGKSCLIPLFKSRYYHVQIGEDFQSKTLPLMLINGRLLDLSIEAYLVWHQSGNSYNGIKA